jgi:hypothetical protein
VRLVAVRVAVAVLLDIGSLRARHFAAREHRDVFVKILGVRVIRGRNCVGYNFDCTVRQDFNRNFVNLRHIIPPRQA